MKCIGKHVTITAGQQGSELPAASCYLASKFSTGNQRQDANNKLAFSLAYLSRQVIWVVLESVWVESVSNASERGCGLLRKWEAKRAT